MTPHLIHDSLSTSHHATATEARAGTQLLGSCSAKSFDPLQSPSSGTCTMVRPTFTS
jgi:hypothetical protein